MKRSQLLFVATLFVSVLSAAPLHYPPANEHPRLFLRQQHVASLRQKFTDNRMAPIRTALLADTRYVGSDTTRLRRCFEANALFYILQVDTSTWQPLAQQNPLFARQAITGAVSLLESVTFPNDINGYRDAGRMEVAASIVYDWCFDQLTPSERTALRTGILRLAREENEYSYPPVNPDTIFGTGAITGHSSENILMRDLLCAGIALYDENPAIYNWAGGQLFDYFVPARNFAYRAQRHYQGDSYSSDRFEFEILVAWIFLRMGYDDVFISEQGKIPYQWIYSRRPDGQLLRDGDTYKSSRQTGVWWEYGNATDLLAAAYYQDSYIQGSQYTPSSYTNEATNIWRVLFRDIDLSSRAVTELPLTKYFPSPAGSMIARTGWDTAVNFNSSNVVAEMKVKEYQFNNHHHMDIGAFQMYYKGALAIDAGIYQSTVSSARYDSEHDQNFNKRTIAHNCMLVYDPAETVYTSNRAVVNDGGQRTPGNGLAAQTLNNLLNDGYNTGQVLGYGFGPDAATPEYSYLKGDIARAYTSKVSRYHRAFVFLDFFDNQHPAALIVYDRITSSNATFAKYWLLHCIEEPEINGTVTTIRRTQAMRNDAGTIVGTYNGKMVHHVLLPEASNAAIQKLGGPGHDFDVLAACRTSSFVQNSCIFC
jgi:heparin/heparan-sulfate lyase